MPIVTVRLPANILDQQSKDRLATGITDACAQAESIPDSPAHRIGIWILVDEVAEGCWFAGGGREALTAFIPVTVVVNPPEGVLDGARRKILLRGISSAVDAAVSDETRQAQTSVVMRDVSEGCWGIREEIVGLKQHATLWGYQHLQHLVAPAGKSPADP